MCLTNVVADGMTLAISEEEQLLLPDPGEKFPIKGHEHEYVVGLDVFHELHCLVCCCIRSIREASAESLLGSRTTFAWRFIRATTICPWSSPTGLSTRVGGCMLVCIDAY